MHPQLRDYRGGGRGGARGKEGIDEGLWVPVRDTSVVSVGVGRTRTMKGKREGTNFARLVRHPSFLGKLEAGQDEPCIFLIFISVRWNQTGPDQPNQAHEREGIGLGLGLTHRQNRETLPEPISLISLPDRGRGDCANLPTLNAPSGFWPER